jgi:hypothetical protein
MSCKWVGIVGITKGLKEYEEFLKITSAAACHDDFK